MPAYELNINDYLRILHRRKLIIIFTFLIVTSVSWFYASRQLPIYEAKSMLKLEERKTVAGLLTEWLVYNPGEVMESATKTVKSFRIMKSTALQLGRINKNTSVEEMYKIISELQSRVSARTVEKTNLIEISATDYSAKGAMDIANIVAETYVKENLIEKKKQARTVRQFIEEQLSSLEKRMREAEDGLRTLGEEVKDVDMSAPIQNRLIELEFELVALMQKYTEKHPKVRQIKDQIQELKGQVKNFSGQELEYARLQREVEVNRKLYAVLKEKLEEARITEAQKVSDISIVNPAVLPRSPINPQKKVSILLGVLVGLLLGFILAFISEGMDTSFGTMEDVETITKLPVLGAIPSSHGRTEGKKSLWKKLLVWLMPKKQTKDEEAYLRLIAHYEPKSLAAEAYRVVRTNLKLNPSLKTILVTSTGPQEGKTTVLINLGIVIAQTGAKTLLVSSDLRRPAIARTFGLAEEPGLNEVITKGLDLDNVIYSISDIMLGKIGIDKIIKTPGIEYIKILPSGRTPHNPSALLEYKEMQDVISELKNKFDVILFDSPPLLPVTDAILLAKKVDGVLIVYEAGRTARKALLRTKMQLESAGAKIIGVVLNHTSSDVETASMYPYPYKYRYYGKTPKESDMTV